MLKAPSVQQGTDIYSQDTTLRSPLHNVIPHTHPGVVLMPNGLLSFMDHNGIWTTTDHLMAVNTNQYQAL